MKTIRFNLRVFNNFLTVIVVLLAVYIMFSPFLASLSWWVKHEAPVVSKPPSVATSSEAESTVLDENTVIIPALGLSEKIYDGESATELNKGVWLRPNTSNPSLGSNTVLSGHRFTYSGQDVFYHLDKVKVGDSMEVHWDGVRYEYTVKEIKIVPPTAIEIEDPTEASMLTVYTCTPLWSAKDRLVLVAELAGESS